MADGAPGPTKAIEQCWPASDRQRCCVHRARNLYARLPERERERVKQAYWHSGGYAGKVYAGLDAGGKERTIWTEVYPTPEQAAEARAELQRRASG